MQLWDVGSFAELDVDIRWAGEPDVLLKLEPSTKWITNAIKIGPQASLLRSRFAISLYAVPTLPGWRHEGPRLMQATGASAASRHHAVVCRMCRQCHCRTVPAWSCMC